MCMKRSVCLCGREGVCMFVCEWKEDCVYVKGKSVCASVCTYVCVNMRVYVCAQGRWRVCVCVWNEVCVSGGECVGM